MGHHRTETRSTFSTLGSGPQKRIDRCPTLAASAYLSRCPRPRDPYIAI
jgi:hypothetical protein